MGFLAFLIIFMLFAFIVDLLRFFCFVQYSQRMLTLGIQSIKGWQ